MSVGIISYSYLIASWTAGATQQFAFGLFIALFAIQFGQALGGLLVFWYAIKHPAKISGQAVFKDRQFRALHLQATFMPSLTLLIALAIIYHYSPFMLGSLVAAFLLSLKHLGTVAERLNCYVL